MTQIISNVLHRPIILLVEDHEANILVASIYLENCGYSFDTARTAKEALERAKSKKYDAILMDVQMPDMSGLEVTKLIREYEIINTQERRLIIGMTAHALSGDQERCLNAGMDDYFSKPFTEIILKDKLHFHLISK